MEENLNKLLMRQIKRRFGSIDQLTDEMKDFLTDINDTYNDFDNDTRLIQNSIEISSQELRNAYQKHKFDADDQRKTISKIHEAIATLTPTNHKLKSEVQSGDSDSHELVDSLIRLIEEYKQTTEALKVSEVKYSEVVENIKEVIFQTDANGLWLFLNNAWEEITGFSVQESLGELFLNYVHPDDRQRNMELFEPLILRKKEYCRHQIRYLTKDGGYRWIEVFARLGLNESNEIIGTYGTLQDITENKYIEDALQTKTSMLEAQTNATIDAILVIDGNQKRVLINQRAIELFEVPHHILDDDDDTLLLKHVVGLTKDPDKFLEKVMYLYNHPNESSSDEIEFKRGTILDRYSAPVLGKNGENLGRIWTFRDITERKQMQTEIETSLDRFKKISSRVPGVLYQYLLRPDGSSCFPFASEAITEIYGVTPEEVREDATKIFSRIYADDLDGVLDSIQESARNLTQWQYEYRVKFDDGTIHSLLGNSVPQRESDGSVLWHGFITDITQSKQAERELQNSESLLRSIMDTTSDVIFVKDRECRFMYINHAGCVLNGKTQEQLVGYSKADFMKDSEELAKFMADDMRIIEGGNTETFEEEIWGADHKLYTFNTTKIPRYDGQGNIIGLIGVAHDITQRKQAEKELEQLSTRLSLATRAGGVGVWDYDTVNNILVWDDQMYGLYGISKENSGDAYKAWQSSFHPDDLERCNAEIQMAIKGEKEFDTEFRVVWPDGTIHFIRALAIVERDESSNPLRMIGTNWDITEKKHDEEKLLIAVKTADAASKSKSEFLANMSHEIRTPLNGVIGFTDLLQNTPLSPVQFQYVKNANTSGHVLLGIINDILDFSKIEAGMLELEFLKTDIIELLGNSVDIIRYAAEKKKLEVLLNIDPKLPRFASVDPVRLKQILANLMGNAVKFTGNGEIELKVIFEEMGHNQGRIRFSVRDTGIGITEEQQKKLFKVFSQADNSTTRRFGGTGLGLVISDMIAKKMGGKINLTSQQGKGSTFYFDIVTDIEHGEMIDKATIHAIKRCFIIDDNTNNRTILEHTLTNWGIECVSCDNGLDALRILETSIPFEVIICDYHMPYIDGLETIKMIREKLCLTPNKQPIILLHSSSDDADLHTKCEQLGVRFKLTKPVKKDELYNFLCNLNTPLDKNAIEENQETETSELDKAATILIAEDNNFNMILVKAMVLRLFPTVEIVEAANGKEALLQYQKKQPKLILMDMQMPEMNGLEATIKIRELETVTQSYTPIVALTAEALKEEQDKCMDAGMDDYLTKPINNDMLHKIISKYLNDKN